MTDGEIQDRRRHQRGCDWLTRGNAWLHLGTEPGRRQALRAFSRALVLLRRLPLEADPEFLSDLGAAWMNRGQALHRAGDPASLNAAIRSYDCALELIGRLPIASSRRFRHNLAAVWLNRAQTQLALAPGGDPATALASAESGLGLVEAAASDDAFAAELALKARCVIGLCLESRLAIAPADQAGRKETVAQAGDAAEAGLALARLWQRRHPARFTPLLIWFFDFGARVYRRHQPHFLAEFLGEAPLALPELRTIAARAIAEARRDLQAPKLLLAGSPPTDRLLQTWRDLQAAEARWAS